MRTLKASGLCVGGGHRVAQVQRIHFSSYNTTSMLQVSVLQWCKTVCVLLSVEQCLLLELFSNGVGVYGVDQMLLCGSDCGCNGGVPKGLLFLLYCCLLCQLNAGGSP